ncbi:MAG: peroxiredoxin [Actinomycetota bacterium]|nr:peroxiredoxin [Rubrobacter sp.]MDQ3508752.1 peroxiredoxin [Actinomycetota bacterium]
MVDLPEKGKSLPNVEFTTEDGGKLAASELGGRKTVLYFYPKDDTPGCTKEACAFRDMIPDYEAAGIQVYGVSLDSPESHRKFREKHGLTFPLLTDEDGKASEAFGVLSEKGRAKRVTFLLDEEAKVAKAYEEVSPETHAAEILADAASL